MEDKKIIAFDMDGTLSPSKSPLSFEMAGLIKKLLELKKVCIISGGNFEQFEKQFLSVLGDANSYNINNLIILPTSGSQVYEYSSAEGKWLQTSRSPLDQNLKAKALRLLNKVINDPEYGILPDPFGEIIEDRDTQISFSARGQLAPLEDKMSWDPTIEKRKKIKAFLDRELPEMSVVIGGVSTIDLLQKGFNKAVGLDLLLKKLNLHKDDLLFVGDGVFPGGNDYSVFEARFQTISIKPNTPSKTSELLKSWIYNM